MSHHILSSNEEDPFEYAFITSDTLEAALDVIEKSFCVDENLCRAVELQKDPNAINELVELCARIAKDGVSLIAIDKKSKKVVGTCFNKLQVINSLLSNLAKNSIHIKVKSSDQATFLEQFASECKCASTKAVLQFLIHAESAVDVFDLCKVDCLFLCECGSVLSDYRRNGIATKLTDLSINIAKDLSLGKNVRVPINNEILSLDHIPHAISAICTSNLSQMISSRLNFSIAADISYRKFIFEGKTFASRIGPKSRTARIVYKLV